MTSNQSCSCCGQLFFKIYEKSYNKVSHEQACKRINDFDSYIQKEFGLVSKNFYCYECFLLFKKHNSYLEAKNNLEERRLNASKEVSACTAENNSLEAEETFSGNTVVQDDKEADVVIDSSIEDGDDLKQNTTIKVENESEANQVNDQTSGNLDESTTNPSVKTENELHDCHEMENCTEASEFATKCHICGCSFTEFYDYLEHRLLCVAEKDMDNAFEVKIEPDEVTEEHSYSISQSSENSVQSKKANMEELEKGPTKSESFKDTGKIRKYIIVPMDKLTEAQKERIRQQSRIRSRRKEIQAHISNIRASVGSQQFKCDQCDKAFRQRWKLNRHIKDVHQNYSCNKCDKTFTRQRNLFEHESTCQGIITYPCDQCQEILKTARELKFHQKLKHKITQKRPVREKKAAPTSKQSPQPGPSTYNCRQCEAKFQHPKQLQVHNARRHGPRGASPGSPRAGPSTYKCHHCPAQFSDRSALHGHQAQAHYQVGAGLHPEPFQEGQEPWVNEDGSVNEGLRDCYRINRALILERYREGPVESIFNIPMFPGIRIWDIGQALQGIYDRQRHAFKINLAFGFIMRHVETGHYRFFKPYDNVNVFEGPILISKRSDISKVLKKLREMDVMAEMSKNRPNTKWRLVLLTNIRVKTYNTNFALGVAKQLPAYITRCKAIMSLNKDPIYKKSYKDNLCLFRCLCVHRHGSVDKRKVTELYDQWEQLHNQREYEEFFDGRTTVQVTPASKFKGVQLQDFPEFEQCFGVNVQMYSLQEDDVVVQMFKSTERYEDTMYVNQHENHCSYIMDFQQYAKKFQCQLCDRMFDHHGNFKQHTKICDKRTLYEYPGGFYKEQKTVFDRLEEFGIHVPEDERTFPWFAVYDFESMLVKLLDDATEKLEWTARHVPISVSLCSNVPGHTEPSCFVHSDMDQLLEQMVQSLGQMQTTAAGHAQQKWGKYLDPLKKHLESLNEEDKEDTKEAEKFKLLYGQFKGYMTTLPVLGFNSAKYDLNLVKQKLAKHLKMHEQEHGFVVKKANAYACITTDTLKFLDISHFLAPGTSYAGFLKAYRVEETKGFFPYEWLDDVSKLDHTQLPSHDAFYSDLKQTNITEEEYAYCQKVWSERGMITFKDFLTWYNNLDVGPFVTAVERLQKFYFEKGIDVLKTAMSVPGIARQLLFKSARDKAAEFSLIDKKNSDLYDTIKENIVGGPSIIFTRHHEAGKTKIRGGKPCEKVMGYDANALYLWAIGQTMPEGMFVRRRADNDFRPEHRDQYMQAFNWLNYLNKYENAHILHQRNNGKEVRLGKYPVDGYDPETKTVYEFQGCYHHGHQCDVTKKVTNEKWQKTKDLLMKRTMGKVSQLRREGYTVVQMWECEFRDFCKAHPKIYGIRDQCRPNFSKKHKGSVTETQILNGVHSDELFGMVEVDIEVPEQWSPEFAHMSVSPREYFEEMCPIFCNTEVEFDDIGEHMRAHVWEHQLSDKPRRLLIGGTKARQILLATPLLKWYLNHGMKVTKIYQVVEYREMACFDSFVKEVSDARRAGDASKELAIIAETMKLIGNSGYGSLIMDKTKHRNLYYVEGENRACFEVNKPQFRQTTCLDDQFYEVEASKQRIKLDLPVQLGFFILQYAKLRMLQFYYDLLDSYVDRSNFEYLEMDTDSAYMALSASSFEEVVKPEKLAEYQRGLTGLCDDKYNPVGDRWFPRECCEKHAKFDKRVPGLFKTEYEGDQMIGLCSKTYIVSKSVPSKATSAVVTASNLLRKIRGQKTKRLRSKPLFIKECKFSCKGISKRLVKEPLNIFKGVLRTGKPASGGNKGFRVRKNGIYSYQQTRCGFSYFYCKRRVLDDGVHTVPLNIVLCPKQKKPEPKEDLLDKLTEEDLVCLLD